MQVTITIQTGNEAMQDETDIANALIEVARRIKAKGLDNVTKVMDANGQSVGRVDVEK